MKRSLISAVKSHVVPLSIAARPAAPTASELFTRAVSSSASSVQPNLTSAFHQLEKTSSPLTVEAAKSYNEIPKTKTVLGLNMDILRKPTQLAQYMQEQGNQLGPIFRVTGTPGLPEMLCLIDPRDVETVFRVGDGGYPRRFPIPEWVEARKELKKPIGLFLA